MATWNEERRRRVIGEQAGPLQDEVMQGFNDQGFGGALAVQDGRVAGGNVGSRMPEDNIPRNRSRVVYGEGNPLLPGASVEGIGRAAAVPTPGAGTMGDFLNPSMAAGRADAAMSSMRAPMSPGRRAIYDDKERRSERSKQSDFDRNLKLIQATPVPFGNQGHGTVGGRYIEPKQGPVSFGAGAGMSSDGKYFQPETAAIGQAPISNSQGFLYPKQGGGWEASWAPAASAEGGKQQAPVVQWNSEGTAAAVVMPGSQQPQMLQVGKLYTNPDGSGFYLDPNSGTVKTLQPAQPRVDTLPANSGVAVGGNVSIPPAYIGDPGQTMMSGGQRIDVPNAPVVAAPGSSVVMGNGRQVNVPNAPMAVNPDQPVFQNGSFNQAPSARRVILDDGQMMMQGTNMPNSVTNRGPVQEKQVISPDGSALWNGQEWIQNPYVKRSTENQLYAPPNGIPESFTMNGLDYVWNPKIGDFDRKAGRITESDQSMGQIRNTQRSGTSLQRLNADQVSAYNAWVQQRYGNGGAQPSVQPVPQATPDPNNPASRWKVN